MRERTAAAGCRKSANAHIDPKRKSGASYGMSACQQRFELSAGATILAGSVRTERDGMKAKVILACFALIAASLASCATTASTTDAISDTFTYTLVAGGIPHHDAHIVDYHIGTTPFAGTGDLFIHYSDGIDVRAWNAPNKKVSMPAEGTSEDDEQIGVDQVEIGKNGRTIGWAEIVAPCCESYSLPLSIGVYQSGKRVLHIGAPGFLDYWTFMDKGRHIIAVWGPPHGPQVLDYQVIDLNTHQVTAEVFGDPKTQKLDPGAPAWALRAQAAINGR